MRTMAASKKQVYSKEADIIQNSRKAPGVGDRISARAAMTLHKKIYRDKELNTRADQFLNPILKVNIKTGEVSINRLREAALAGLVSTEVKHEQT